MKTIRTTYSLLFVCISFMLYGQTPKENLEKGVEIYNAMREYSKVLNNANATKENAEDIKKRAENTIELMDKVIAQGNADQIKAARYFKINATYQMGYGYGLIKDYKKTLQILKTIEDEMNSYTSASFPIRYAYFDKNFKIEYNENFAATQAEFYTVLAEIYQSNKDNDKALEYFRKAVKMSQISDWQKYVSAYKIADFKKSRNEYDLEMLEANLTAMEQLVNFNEDLKKVVLDGKFDYFNRLSENYDLALAKQDKWGYRGEMNLKAANSAIKYLENYKTDNQIAIIKRGLNWYKDAFENGKYEAKSAEMALQNAQKYEGKTSEVGKYLINRMAEKTRDTDCEGIAKLIPYYEFFDMKSKVAELKAKGEKCQKDREAEAKRQSEIRRKEAEELEKKRRKDSRDAHFYVGVNVLPLFSKPADLGGVINIGARNNFVEASFLKVTKKKENYFDLSVRGVEDVPEHKWDGFFTHIAYKSAYRGKSTRNMKVYTGFLGGYNQRTFEPFQATVTNTTTNKSSSVTFAPKTTQYIFMVNTGVMTFNYLGFDMYMGIGATYNKFDGGNNEMWNKADLKIEDAMVANRKPSYFGFTMRAGVSVGFGR